MSEIDGTTLEHPAMEASREQQPPPQQQQQEEEEGDEESQLLRPRRPTIRLRSTPNPWPTIDGPLGLTVEESEGCARRFFLWGWCLLPLLWGVNCLYFWPVLRTSRPFSSSSSPSVPHPFDPIRKYVVRSAIGFVVAAVLVSSWSLTFAIGGRRLFGSLWDNLLVYNVADKLGLTDWNSM